MVMNGFDTDFDGENEIYAVNSIPFHYVEEPIRVKRNELVRIYLVNLLEYDQINSFHIHANFFEHFPTGTRLEPTEYTDTIIQGQGQRADARAAIPVRREVHVPRPQDRVRRARLAGLLRGRGLMEANTARAPIGSGAPAWLLGAIPLALIVARPRTARPARRAGPRGPNRAARRGASRSSARSCGRARSSSPCATTAPTRSRSPSSRSTRRSCPSRAPGRSTGSALAR